MQGVLIFKYGKNQETIRVNRPTALDLFNAMSVVEQIGKGMHLMTYYNYLLVKCWDKGNDLSFLKNLTPKYTGGRQFWIVIKKKLIRMVIK